MSAAAVNPATGKPVDGYACIFTWMLPIIREIGLAHGYAIAVHGSMKRDLDLVAVPWVNDAKPADVLVAALCDRLNAHVRNVDGAKSNEPTAKPHGRRGEGGGLGRGHAGQEPESTRRGRGRAGCPDAQRSNARSSTCRGGPMNHRAFIACLLTVAAARAQTLTAAGWLLDSPTLVSIDTPATPGPAPELWLTGDSLLINRTDDPWHPGVVHYSVVFKPRDPLDPPAEFVISGPRGTVILLTWLDVTGVRCENRGMVIRPCDIDGDTRENVSDFIAFLNGYAAGTVCRYDGRPACDVGDFVAFVNAWRE